MSEIEKMYENVGIDYEERYNNCTLNKEGQCELKCSCDICKYSEEKYIYPLFTAEKQILLLQLLARIDATDYFQFFFYKIKQEWVFRLDMLTELSCESAYIYESRNRNFDECIAGLINIIWQDLTSEEKEVVRGILRT